MIINRVYTVKSPLLLNLFYVNVFLEFVYLIKLLQTKWTTPRIQPNVPGN
jgi:hypothetical protein